MDKGAPIYVAGHRGLVGTAVVRKLQSEGHSRIIVRSHDELDLTNQAAVRKFFNETPITYALVAAARVGGIQANANAQADFLYDNLMIASNVIKAAADAGVAKLLFLGSSCIYPRLAPQPIQEASLLTGELEPTNEGYAIAKIAGLKLCEMYRRQYGKNFISAMPTNLYGSGDNFHPLNSHVIPGMMRRFHEAKASGAEEVIVWGTGTPRREFLHVDDLAEALYVLMDRYEGAQTINVGSNEEVTIAELAALMREVVGYRGQIRFDSSKPDGTPRKILDSSRVRALGWSPRLTLRQGLAETYEWAVAHDAFARVQPLAGAPSPVG